MQNMSWIYVTAVTSLGVCPISPATSTVDLFADDVLTDPYPIYAELRELGAAVHLTTNDVYALTRYDAIRDALADPGTFSSRSVGFNPMVNEALQGTSLASDPPVHTELRATLTENLSPRALRGLAGQIQTQGRRPGRGPGYPGIVRRHRCAGTRIPPRDRRRSDRLHRLGAQRHAALGTSRDGGYRPDEPTDCRELPHCRRALRLVRASPRRGSGTRSRWAAAYSMPRPGERSHPILPARSSTSIWARESIRRSPRSATSSRCSQPFRTNSI